MFLEYAMMAHKEGHMKKLILSERKTKAQAALAGVTIKEINERAELGHSYISRKWGSDKVTLATVNRVAQTLGCAPGDLLEEVEETELPAKT